MDQLLALYESHWSFVGVHIGFEMERKNDFKTLAIITRKEKPTGLRLVGGVNQQIPEKTLNYEARKRPTAKEFLKDLSEYYLTDGSA